jgi:LPXTG-motif cell wall-anchored protein
MTKWTLRGAFVAAVVVTGCSIGASAAVAQEAPSYVVGDTVSVDQLVGEGVLSPGPYYVKLAKRVCDTYAIIPGNANQSTNSESAQPVLGANPYSSPSDRVSLAVEDDPESAWASSCAPRTGWDFTIGTGVTRVNGISQVANPEPLVWEANNDGTATLVDTITTRSSVFDVRGGVAIVLTPAQFDMMQQGTLRVSEVTQANPGFGTLRCGNDRQNGDNIEFVSYSATIKTLCFAYNSTEVPTPPTTTTTVAETTTTTTTMAATTTTTKVAPTVAPTTVAPSSSVAGTTVVPATLPATLPRTGSTSLPLALVGMALAAMGALMVTLNRRWAHRS